MKILMIGTFPIASPKHGGQLRNKAIYDHYSAEGHEVRYCGVSIVGWYDEHSDDDIIIDTTGLKLPTTFDIAPEITMGRLLYENPTLKKRVTKLLQEFTPDVIQFEQPYLYAGVKDILQEKNWQGDIVYSSHNIEADLKREILLSTDHVGSELARRSAAIEEVRHYEVELTLRAKLIIACTEKDAETLRGLGAKKTKVIPNRAMKHTIEVDNLDDWKKKLQSEGIKKLILFIGSAHPPNLNGFKDLVGYGLGFIPRDTRLFIIGGVCDLINHDLFYNVPPHIITTFHLRAKLLGKVENEDLASLLRLADTIILPITQGGGSNLKTAEAILANKKIVATHTSFRSFEKHENAKNVIFADAPDEFKKAIVTSVQSVKQEDPAAYKLAHSLTWDHALKGLAREVSQL